MCLDEDGGWVNVSSGTAKRLSFVVVAHVCLSYENAGRL